MKPKCCPKCGSTDIGDRWAPGRKLIAHCNECSWKNTPRTPEKKKISRYKKCRLNGFGGHDYIIYDGYGYEVIFSQSFGSATEARKSMERDLLSLAEKLPCHGKCTGVLFYTPPTVSIEGEKYQVVNGKVDWIERGSRM